MTRRINLIMIHGISETIKTGWFQDWIDLIPNRNRFNFIPITWEDLVSKKPRREGSLPDLIGDLRAMFLPSVEERINHAIGAADIPGSNTKTWVLGHSLGSALAHQTLLRRRSVVERLITFGCPLHYLYYFGLYESLDRPLSTRDWYNVWGFKDPIVSPFYRRVVFKAGFKTADKNFPVWSNHLATNYLKTEGMQEALS